MSGRDISTFVGDLYAAASLGDDWSEVGDALSRRLNADSGSLRILQPNGHSVNFLRPFEQVETVYSNVFRASDPIRAAANHLRPVGSDFSDAVRTLEELVPAEVYSKSDFYNGFAKPNRQNHYVVGALGDESRALVSFFRASDPFDEYDKQFLVQLLPHLQRVVQLHHRIRHAEVGAGLGHTALESITGAAFVVDGGRHLKHSNTAAQLLAADQSPFILSRHSSTFSRDGLQLAVRNRRDSARFDALIADAAGGGSGGAMRVEDLDATGQLTVFAVVVSPQPVLDGVGVFTGRGAPGLVLVLVNELSRPKAPPVSLLSDLFGLSAAESAVAVALLGGQTADMVAAERNVSLDTVRSQIRTVLRKSEAANLRDFERMGATLAILAR